jgi:hypothetical protein
MDRLLEKGTTKMRKRKNSANNAGNTTHPNLGDDACPDGLSRFGPAGGREGTADLGSAQLFVGFGLEPPKGGLENVRCFKGKIGSEGCQQKSGKFGTFGIEGAALRL